MFEHLMWLHGIELVQYSESAELDWFGTLTVMAVVQGFILSLLSIEEKYALPYVVYLLEGHTCFHNIQLCQDAAAKLAVY
jgi:hypothetical protein